MTSIDVQSSIGSIFFSNLYKMQLFGNIWSKHHKVWKHFLEIMASERYTTFNNLLRNNRILPNWKNKDLRRRAQISKITSRLLVDFFLVKVQTLRKLKIIFSKKVSLSRSFFKYSITTSGYDPIFDLCRYSFTLSILFL